MDFSSWQTWVILAIAAFVILGLIGTIVEKFEKKGQGTGSPPRDDPRMAVQASMLAAMSAAANRFDREMYIDDMTSEQLEDEHVWRTAAVTCYNVIWAFSDMFEDHPSSKICKAITGKPYDRQVAGLSEYYLETAYEQMMAVGEDHYWDDELIGHKDRWDTAKREQILLAALITLERAADIHAAIRRSPPGPNDNGAHLIPFIDRVGEAFFGDTAAARMQALRAQAQQIAATIEF